MNLQEVTMSEPRGVDTDQGVIRDVKILGKHSKNGREYSDNAREDARKLYDGVHVNFDHPSPDKARAERAFKESIGVLHNIRHAGTDLRGDIHYLTSHPWAPVLAERAEKFPNSFGLSHNAEGDTRKDSSGKVVVESLKRVHSVDIVTRPATNAGLYESENGNGHVSLQEYLEAQEESTATKVLEVIAAIDQDLEVEGINADPSKVLESLLTQGLGEFTMGDIQTLLEDHEMDQPQVLTVDDLGDLSQEDLLSIPDAIESGGLQVVDGDQDVSGEISDEIVDAANEAIAAEQELEDGIDDEIDHLADEHEEAVLAVESVLSDMNNRLEFLEKSLLLERLLTQEGIAVDEEDRAILMECESPEDMAALIDGVPRVASHNHVPAAPIFESQGFLESYPTDGASFAKALGIKR